MVFLLISVSCAREFLAIVSWRCGTEFFFIGGRTAGFCFCAGSVTRGGTIVFPAVSTGFCTTFVRQTACTAKRVTSTPVALAKTPQLVSQLRRSEERRVGKECRYQEVTEL